MVFSINDNVTIHIFARPQEEGINDRFVPVRLVAAKRRAMAIASVLQKE